MKKTVLITGGMGYLGGRIAARIAGDPAWHVRLGTRRQIGPPAWLPQADVVLLDVLRPETFAAGLQGVHAIVHLAAVNEIESAADLPRARQVNTFGTEALAAAAVLAGVERFIYFSTAHVYGAPLAGHITERTPPDPVHPYAITHYDAEKFILTAQANKRIQGIVVRLSNGFGVPMHSDIDRWTLVVNDLCMQAVRDKKLVLRSSGLQQRDFITLHDVGRAAAHFLGMSVADCADGLFNLGGECSMTVLEMTQRIAKCCREAMGYEPQVLSPEPPAHEAVPALQYDIDKLKRTGFRLNGDMDEEIRQVLRMCALMQKVRKA